MKAVEYIRAMLGYTTYIINLSSAIICVKTHLHRTPHVCVMHACVRKLQESATAWASATGAPQFTLSVYLYMSVCVRVCVQEASFRPLAGGVLTYFWPWT